MPPETRSVVVRLSAETAQYIAQMQASGRMTVNAMKPAEAAVMRQSAAIDTLGGKAGKVGMAAAAGVALMAKAAIDWESQWAGVSKTVNGTSDELNALEGDLRGLAREMPATHQEIASTAEAAGQLGVATDDVTDFTKVMVEMGSSTNLAADDAATSIAQFMNVMQSASGDVDEIGNTIVALGNKGASTESQITDMAQRVAGVGTTIGATESDVLGLSAAMANLGIQSELGGGAVQRVLLGINTQVASGGDKLERYAEIAGTSADEFAEKWRTSPLDAFDDLVQGLGRIQDSGGDVASVLDSMGVKGTQNLQVLLRLAGSGDMLSRSLDQSATAWEQNDALTKEYGKRAETTASQVQVAWNQIKDAAITGGAATLPIIADIASGVGTIADAYGGLPGPIQDITTAGLAVTALLGGGLWFGAKAVRGVRDTRESLAVLRPEISRVGSTLATKSGVRQFTSDLGIMAATSRTAGASTTRELERTAAASSRVRSQLATVGVRGGAALAGLALATTGAADGMGLTNTMSLALMGTIAGPWGAAIGGGIGLVQDFRAASKDASGAIDGFNDSLDGTDVTKALSAFQALQDKAAGMQADLHDVSGAGDFTGDVVGAWTDILGTGLQDVSEASDQSIEKLTNLTGVLQGVAQANGDFIASADNGLQNLAYGDLDDMSRIAAKAQPVLEELGYSLDDLMSMKPGSAESVKAVQAINDALAHADSQEGRVEALGDAIGGLGDSMDSTEDQAKSLGDALDALLDPGLDLSAATDQWTTALRHLDDDLAKNNRTLKGNSDAAIKNREAIRDRVGQMKDVLVAESNAGASSEQLSRSLRNQRKALIDAGEAAGISRKDMRDYLDTIGLTPDLVRTIVQADTGQAISAMDAVKAMLDRLDGTRARTVVETIYQQTNKPKALPGSPDGAARGTTVPKTGRGYADRHHYLLADGEEVTTNQNGEADTFRPELKDINAGMSRADVAGRMIARGLAAGGTTGFGLPTGSSGPGPRTLDDRLAIAQALQELRDITRQLNERVKDGKHKGDLAVRGMDRKVLELQLKAAQADLRAAQHKEDREFKQGVADARNNFSLTAGLAPAQALTPGEQAAQDTREALKEFARDIREAGGHVGKNFDALSANAAALTARYADNAAEIADLTSQIDSIRSAASQSFMHDPFTGGLSDFDTQVSADTNDATDMATALAKAAAKGLDGPLAAALASSGNLALAQEFEGLSAEQIQMREDAYAARTASGKQLGDVAVAMSGLQQEVGRLTVANNVLVNELAGLNARIESSVYQGSFDGTAQNKRKGDKKVAGRVGAGR